MGLLGDIFSGIDTQKRRLSGLLDDPMGTLAQKIAQFGEDQQGLLNTQSNAYPMPGERSVLMNPEVMARARQELADAGAMQAMQAATVWHGSPHKFDKFDSSKIGTGEGHQMYGNGLYLADVPDVAKRYQKNLSSKRGGSLYKVDLPDEHIAKMLDWDKPLTEQPPALQKLVSDTAAVRAQEKYGPLQLSEIRVDDQGIPLAQNSGGAAYHYLAAPRYGATPEDVASQLQTLGIPGIRYLDGGSRGVGKGSSNYVVFPGNEGLLSILERNGQSLGFK